MTARDVSNLCAVILTAWMFVDLIVGTTQYLIDQADDRHRTRQAMLAAAAWWLELHPEVER